MRKPQYVSLLYFCQFIIPKGMLFVFYDFYNNEKLIKDGMSLKNR